MMSQPAGLRERLRSATLSLHAEAEQAGVVAELLAGRASRRAYAHYLANLLPVYEALEAALAARQGDPRFAVFATPALSRSAAIAADLAAMAGRDFRTALSPVPAASRYRLRIEAVAARAPLCLVGHAYTRYLGDLNGGRILAARLAASLSLPASALRFYGFPGLGDLARFRRQFEAALDGCADDPASIDAIVDEAKLAFRLNIELACEIPSATTAVHVA